MQQAQRSPNGAAAAATLAAVFAIATLAGCSDRAPIPVQPRQTPAGRAPDSGVERYDRSQQVEQLRQLRDSGLITEEEFEAKKKRVLERP